MSLSDPSEHHNFSQFPLLHYDKKYLQHSNFLKLSAKLEILHYYTYDVNNNAVFLCEVDNIKKKWDVAGTFYCNV